MEARFAFSHPLIAADAASTVDLLIGFKGDTRLAQTSRRPLNLSLVIDRSGSMAGAPLKHAIKAAQKLVDQMTPADTLSVIIYDDNIETLLPPQRVEDSSAVRSILSKVRAGGCTNLSGGWLRGCDLVQGNLSKESLNRVLLLTDGQANVGVTDPKVLIQTAKQRADEGVITTTLGFGTRFNEDLLIGMANNAGGNFYFIQSPDDAEDVFRIELESLLSVVAQNLAVTLEPVGAVQVLDVLNNFRFTRRGEGVEVFVGDVYATEERQLGLEVRLPAGLEPGVRPVLRASYAYHAVQDGAIRSQNGALEVSIPVGSAADAAAARPDAAVIEQTSRLRIARVKDDAIDLADRGDFVAASQKLRQAFEDIKLRAIGESFEVGEELDQLDYYAQRFEKRQFDDAARKELRDQSFQARARGRGDPKLRGITSGSADTLAVVSSADAGVIVRCEREGGKLRVRVVSDGYDSSLNVQFPRAIREEGVTYLVESITTSADGGFYRATGNIQRLVRPGEEHLARRSSGGSTPRSTKPANPSAQSAADLETVTSVGAAVLVQCVKEGSKLRARVVSDGYNPDWNMRFPRSIREEGILYVVDSVIEVAGGGSYIACGSIKRLIQ